MKKVLKNKYQLLIFSIIIIGFIKYSYVYDDHQVHIYFLDVGQGDSIIISDNDTTFIIDGGGDRFMDDNYNKGKEVLIPFIKEKGIVDIDCVFISHIHYDHIKGILELIGIIPIKIIVLPEPYKELLTMEKENNSTYDNYFMVGDEYELLDQLIEKCNIEKIPIKFMNNEDIIKSDRVTMTCVYPMDKAVYKENENQNSMVLKVDVYDFSCLLTGDIEVEAEKWLVENNNLIKDINILKVPHHGSNSSSTEEFINHVNPNKGIITVGENFFGHPSDIIKLRYKNFQIPLYTTKNCGMIEVIINRDGYMMKSFKGELIDETIKRTN